jgi:outer membrane protein OmpA-like peptidoglycan-associated protein
VNKQNQWLFEALPVAESASHSSNQEYYSNPEWGGEWELQKSNPYGLGEEEWERSPIQSVRETISGFSRYSNVIPPQERAKIARIAQMIVQSHRSGQPIRTVRLVGHADRDVQRGASFEKKISGDRAQSVKQALIDVINIQSNHITQISAIRSRGTTSAIASLIHWQIEADGANQLVVHNPKTEQERVRNRRVQIIVQRRPPRTPSRPKPAVKKPAIEIVSPIPGTTFVISAVPGMPTINAQARIVGVTPDPTPTTTFEWKLLISFNAHTCPNGPNRVINAPRIIVEKVVGGSFTPVFDFIRGGDLTLIVRAVVDGKMLEARTRGLKIKGTNPDRSVIQAILPRMLAQMACQESGQRQFNAPVDGGIGSCPLFSSDKLGGVGLFQLTNPPPGPDMFWDWRTNAAAAEVLLGNKRSGARDYPGQVRRSRGFRQLVNQFNQARRRSGRPEITITLPNFTEGDFDTPEELELDAIRGFNGFAGRDRFGFPLHEFRVAVDPQGLLRVNIDDVARTGEAIWERVPSADRPQGTGDPRYVENVLGARC